MVPGSFVVAGDSRTAEQPIKVSMRQQTPHKASAALPTHPSMRCIHVFLFPYCRRLEGIVAADAFGVDYDKTGTQHTPTSLAVSLARGIKDTKQDVQQLQHSCAVLQQQQELVLHAEKSTASQLQQLELRLQQVEQQQAAVHQQIGLSGRLGSVRSASPACMSSGCSSPALPGLPQHKDGLPATTTVHAQASLGARVLQLEQQVHSFTESAAHAQVCGLVLFCTLIARCLLLFESRKLKPSASNLFVPAVTTDWPVVCRSVLKLLRQQYLCWTRNSTSNSATSEQTRSRPSE